MNSLMKLAAQFALLFVAVWVIASALGQKSQASPGKATGCPRNLNKPGGNNCYRGRYSQYGSRLAKKFFQPEVATSPSALSQENPAPSWVL